MAERIVVTGPPGWTLAQAVLIAHNDDVIVVRTSTQKELAERGLANMGKTTAVEIEQVSS